MTHKTKALSEFFAAHRVKRAAQHTHRPCPQHGHVKIVCPTCAYVICPKCRNHKHDSSYTPPKHLAPLWHVLGSLGATSIEPLPEDPTQYRVIFPALALDTVVARDLADRLWRHPPFTDLASPSAYHSGRINTRQWWVGFTLKEQK